MFLKHRAQVTLKSRGVQINSNIIKLILKITHLLGVKSLKTSATKHRLLSCEIRLVFIIFRIIVAC